MAAMLDPFAIRTYDLATKYWTVAEKNNLTIGFSGLLLWNRLMWLSVGGAIFALRRLAVQLPARPGSQEEGKTRRGGRAPAPRTDHSRRISIFRCRRAPDAVPTNLADRILRPGQINHLHRDSGGRAAELHSQHHPERFRRIRQCVAAGYLSHDRDHRGDALPVRRRR